MKPYRYLSKTPNNSSCVQQYELCHIKYNKDILALFSL